MALPIKIKLRGVPLSNAAQKDIREQLAKLNQRYSRLVSCEITLNANTRKPGKIANVTIDLHLPNGDVSVNHDHKSKRVGDDVRSAIKQAFDTAERKLSSLMLQRLRRRNLANAERKGYITKIFPERGYGIIEAATGERVYFYNTAIGNSVFDRLVEGQAIDFRCGKGPDADPSRDLHASSITTREHGRR